MRGKKAKKSYASVSVYFTVGPECKNERTVDYSKLPKGWKWAGHGCEITDDSSLLREDIQFTGPIGTEHTMIQYLEVLFSELKKETEVSSYSFRSQVQDSDAWDSDE